MQRPLGSFETAAALSHDVAAFLAVTAVELQGDVSPRAVTEALRALQARHPLLRVRIVHDRGRWSFGAMTGGVIPLRVVEDRAPGAWQALVEEEMNRRLDAAAGPLLRCTYLAGRDSSWIILAFHHAILDGVSGARMLEDLLRLCGSPDHAAPAVDVPLPPPLDALFPARFRGWRRAWLTSSFLARQIADEIRCSRAVPPAPAVEGPGRSRFLPVIVPREVAAALTRRAREQRIGLNAVLLAALLLSAWRWVHGGRPAPLRGFSFADLRRYLDPPVPLDAPGCYISPMGVMLPPPIPPEPWTLARQVYVAIDRAARRGDKFAAAALLGPMMRIATRLGRRSRATAAVSYLPAPRLDGVHGGVEVRRLVAGVSNGPNPVAADFSVVAVLFGGELTCGLSYCDRDVDPGTARGAAGEFEHLLRGMASVP